MDKLKKFNGLQISSKFGICGLPIRLDSYKNCTFQCRYCFANNRKVMAFDHSNIQVCNIKSIENKLNKIFDKKNINEEDFLDVLISQGYTWHCGGMSDPFQPCEKEYHITKDIIDLTSKYNINILFSTKSDTVYESNIDPNLHTFQLSVTNINNRTDLEPNVPPIEKRIEFFNYLKKNGFKVGIRIQPFIPDISTLDIVKSFPNADHFTIEGIKMVPNNKENVNEVLSIIPTIKREDFTCKGLLNLRPEIRTELYKPFIEYFKEHNISYSISDNDLREYSNNKCCCGDKLVNKSTDFNTTAMIMKYGKDYSVDDLKNEVNCDKCGQCICDKVFYSTRTQGLKTVLENCIVRYHQKTSPFSPKFQYDGDK